MHNNPTSDAEIIAWLKREYAQPFTGWDFSYLDRRRVPRGALPWHYAGIVLAHLPHAKSLLDIDTGDGEAFAEILQQANFQGHAAAVETHAPNRPLARKRLAPLGAQPHDTVAGAAPFNDASFDLVINRHGGSLDPREIFRILQRGGRCVTEQLGERTNHELRELFNCEAVTAGTWPHDAGDARSMFGELGFVVEEILEHSYPVRFMDVGAMAYYLKAIPWEVPEFSIDRYATTLVALHHATSQQGFCIDATYHAYLLVARKP
jgi:SAM-dependent methyltransferase